MTKRELVKQAIEGRQNGPVPYCIQLTQEAYKLYGDRIIEEFGTDKIKEDYKEGRLNQVEAVMLSMGDHIVHVAPVWWDWCNIPEEFKEEDTPEGLPDTIGRGSYEEFFKKVAYIKENYDAYILVCVWGSHWEKANGTRGIENFLYDLAADPDWCKKMLDTIIRKNLVMLENMLTCKDIDGVLLGSDWGTQNDMLMSPDCFRSLIKGGEQQEYDLVKKYGKNVFVHSCGCITRIIGDLTEIGLQVLNPIQPECMDIYKLKEQYGDKLAFYGGISTQRTLPYGTPEEVEEEANQVIEAMSKNGGYITASSQDIMEDVPYENLVALLKTAKKWAQEV